MTIALFNVASTTGATLTLPAGIAAGDLLVVVANRDSNTTIPSLGAGMTNRGTSAANSSASRIMSKVLDGSETSITGLTNNTYATAAVYRGSGGAALSFGAVASAGTGNGTTITYPAVTFDDADGSSWGGRAGFHRGSSAVGTNPPSGTTLRGQVGTGPQAALFDTNGAVTGLSSAAAVVGSGSGWHAWSYEIVETVSGGGSPITGAAAVTLAAATATGAAKLTVKGSASTTLAAATATATGKLALRGSLAATLRAALNTASGKLPVKGSGSTVLRAATAAAAGKLKIVGAASGTLRAATCVATSGSIKTGTTAASLRRVVLASAAKLAVKGQLVKALRSATVSASGGSPNKGALSRTLRAATAQIVANTYWPVDDGLVVFPFDPNWRDPITETLAYLTEIISSRSGREQRRAWRLTPRRSFEFSVLADGDRNIALKTFMRKYGKRKIILAEPTRSVAITTALEPGDYSFSVKSVPSWLKVGAVVCLQDGREALAEAAAVESIAGTLVTLEDPVGLSWSPGELLRPGLRGDLSDNLTGSLFTSTVKEVMIRFDIEPASEAFDLPPVAPLTWNDRELFKTAPNFAAPLSLTLAQPRETIDYNIGKTKMNYPIQFASRTMQGTYLGQTNASAQALKDVFRRARGRRGEFYAPSWEADIPVAGSHSGTTFVSPGVEIVSAFADSTVERAVLFKRANGDTATRVVSSITVQSGNSLFTLSSALPWAINETTQVSWLYASRFASDELVVSWRTAEVAELVMNVVTLEDL